MRPPHRDQTQGGGKAGGLNLVVLEPSLLPIVHTLPRFCCLLPSTLAAQACQPLGTASHHTNQDG